MDQRSVFRVFLDDLRPGSRAGREERDATRRADVEFEAARVLAVADDPALRAVLELHRPVIEGSGWWPVCLGCDGSGADAEPPAWPCRTWTLIEQALTR